MDLFESIGAKLNQVGSNTSQKLKNFSSVSSLSIQNSKLEKVVTELYARLGILYYEKYASVNQADFNDVILEITEYKKQIELNTLEMQRLKAVPVCNSCGTALSENTVFCPNCGTKAKVFRICPKCNVAVDGDFCSKCGTKVVLESEVPPSIKVCPSCGTESATGSAFCSKCGSTYSVSPVESTVIRPATCQKCGKPLRAGSKFCPSCGYRSN